MNGPNELHAAIGSPQLNAPAVSVASILTGIATYMQYVPPVAGAISSIIGVFLAAYMLRHHKRQAKIDIETEKKITAERHMAELELKRMRDDQV